MARGVKKWRDGVARHRPQAQQPLDGGTTQRRNRRRKHSPDQTDRDEPASAPRDGRSHVAAT